MQIASSATRSLSSALARQEGVAARIAREGLTPEAAVDAIRSKDEASVAAKLVRLERDRHDGLLDILV